MTPTQALCKLANFYATYCQESHEAMRVGGYVPVEDDVEVCIPLGWLRALAEEHCCPQCVTEAPTLEGEDYEQDRD